MINRLLMPKAYTEVLEILRHIPLEDYNKIPTEIIENMKLNADKEYTYIVTHLDNFQKQEMLKETETILAVLFRDYLATEEQRRKILEKEKLDLNILEEEKRKKYNPDNIFKNKCKEQSIENSKETSKNNTNNALIECKESFFIRFKNFIFKLLHINH